MTNHFINTPDPLNVSNSMIDIESTFNPVQLSNPVPEHSFFGTVTEVFYYDVTIYVKNKQNQVKSFKTLYYKVNHNLDNLKKEIKKLQKKVEKENLVLQVFYKKIKTDVVKYEKI